MSVNYRRLLCDRAFYGERRFSFGLHRFFRGWQTRHAPITGPINYRDV